MAENEKLVRSVRADKQTFDRLAKLADEFGASQGAALEALINLWDTQQAKGALPGRRSDIEDFDSHLQAIQRAFLHSLDLSQGAEARALDACRAALDSKDQVIKDLQNRIATLEQEAAKATQSAQDAAQNMDAANEMAEAAKAALRAAEAARDSAVASVADKQAVIESLNRQLVEAADTAAKNADATVKFGELQAKYDSLLAASKAEVEIAAAKAEAERERAVREAEARSQDTIMDLMRQVNALTLQLAGEKSAATGTGKRRKKQPED